MTEPGPYEVRPVGDSQNLVYFNNACDCASVHTARLIIMTLLLPHIRRVRAVSVLQYSKFAYARVGFRLCVRALCVSDCACVCVL